MALNDFKEFVGKKPTLASYVNNGNMTWQKFYEMYEMYGSNNDIWNNYNNNYVKETLATDIGLKQIFNTFKSMDLATVQNGIGSIQKGINLLQELFVKNKGVSTSVRTSEYEPRPLHRYFDD